MVGSNGNPDRVRNVFLINNSMKGHVLASFLIRIDPVQDLSERYLTMALRSDRIQESITESTSGSTGLKNLSLEWLRALRLALPPLTEQRAIAGMLDSVGEAIERAREERVALQAVKASASDALLSGRVRVS